jgi:hypothetical protein
VRIAAALGWPAVADLKVHEVQPNPDFNPEATEIGQGERGPPTPE